MEKYSSIGKTDCLKDGEFAWIEGFRLMARKWQTIVKTKTIKHIMILQFFFRQLSAEKQVSYLQKNGVSLGSRVKNGRRIYVYMLRNLFIEVMFENDDANSTPEKVNMLRGLKNLNAYLEKEFRATF